MENTTQNSRLQERLNKVRENDVPMSPAAPVASKEEILAARAEVAPQPKVDDDMDVDVIDGGEIGTIRVTEAAPTEETGPAAPGDDLFDGLKTIEAENAAMADELAEKQEAVLDGRDPGGEDDTTEVPTDDVEAILSQIEDADAYDDSDEILKNDNIEELLVEIERQKVFATEVNTNSEATGPSQYVVEVDETYQNAVEEVMDVNSIRITKPTNTGRNALLERYTNVGNSVAIPLPNSGIFVQITGAGVDELIAMSRINTENPMADELNKLKFVCDHIINSSIGPMKLQQLIKVVSYYDLYTLYYGLLAATHPDHIEISRICPICEETYYVDMRTRDLLLNATDFQRCESDIRDNVTTYKRLIESAQLSKVYKKFHSNGNMLIHYKHPSIEAWLQTYHLLRPEILQRYEDIVNFAFCIDKIALRDKKTNMFVEYKDPNEIVLIISRLKDINDKYEIADMVDEVRPSYIPTYGYQKCTCPHCASKNDTENINVPSLLFTLARDEDWMAMMRRAAVIQKRKASEKKG